MKTDLFTAEITFATSNIVFSIIFFALGILIFIFSLKLFRDKKVDYSKYPIANAEVLGTTSEYYETTVTHYWQVRFTDYCGNEITATDDDIAYSKWSFENYHIPKSGEIVKVYYWSKNEMALDWNVSEPFKFGEKPVVNHYFHFCDESFYEINRAKKKRSRLIGILFSILMGIFAVLILFFGNGTA